VAAAREEPGTMLRKTGTFHPPTTRATADVGEAAYQPSANGAPMTMSSKAEKGAWLSREGVNPPATGGDSRQADGDAIARACRTRAQADGLDGAAASPLEPTLSVPYLFFCGLCGAAGPRWAAA